MTRRLQLRSRRSWRGRTLVVRLLRALVAVIALQISGASHFFADLVVPETLASHVEHEKVWRSPGTG